MRARGANSASFAKVKGHCTDADVQRGRATLEDKVGNDGADDLACAGADEHAIDNAVATLARHQHLAAKGVHSMMVAIVIARRKREEEMQREQLDEAVVPDHEFAQLEDGDHVPWSFPSEANPG